MVASLVSDLGQSSKSREEATSKSCPARTFSRLLILAAMRQRFLVLQNSAEIAHVKFPDPGGVSISAEGPEVVGLVLDARFGPATSRRAERRPGPKSANSLRLSANALSPACATRRTRRSAPTQSR